MRPQKQVVALTILYSFIDEGTSGDDTSAGQLARAMINRHAEMTKRPPTIMSAMDTLGLLCDRVHPGNIYCLCSSDARLTFPAAAAEGLNTAKPQP